MILCDTDVLVDILRKQPAAVAWVQSVAAEELVVPGYVAMQLVQGCRSKNDVAAVMTILRPFRFVWPSAEFCDKAFQSLMILRVSHGLDLIDALIAQTAVALAVPLHTLNVKHFAPVPDLKTIQPYQR